MALDPQTYNDLMFLHLADLQDLVEHYVPVKHRVGQAFRSREKALAQEILSKHTETLKLLTVLFEDLRSEVN